MTIKFWTIVSISLIIIMTLFIVNRKVQRNIEIDTLVNDCFNGDKLWGELLKKDKELYGRIMAHVSTYPAKTLEWRREK